MYGYGDWVGFRSWAAGGEEPVHWYISERVADRRYRNAGTLKNTGGKEAGGFPEAPREWKLQSSVTWKPQGCVARQRWKDIGHLRASVTAYRLNFYFITYRETDSLCRYQ